MMKIGLTLGGGGARGAAHVGVIMELERIGFRPDLITGSSIGGLVGALYAAGLNGPDLATFFRELTLGHLYSFPGSAPSISSNVKIEKLLEDSVGRIAFTDLQISLALSTVDLVSRKEMVLDEGDLISAVLATTALPVLLPPIERGGYTLIDGGVLNNVPFDVARARGATFVLAVDLTNTLPYGSMIDNIPPGTNVLERVLTFTQRNRTWQILSAVTDIITGQSLNARLAISQPDLLLRPDLGTVGIFDFHRWEEGIEAGRNVVKEHEDRLRELVT